jgi:hypothetical protein
MAKATEAEAVARKARAEAVEIARIARESDPEYIAMMALQALYKKYDVSLSATTSLARMSSSMRWRSGETVRGQVEFMIGS